MNGMRRGILIRIGGRCYRRVGCVLASFESTIVDSPVLPLLPCLMLSLASDYVLSVVLHFLKMRRECVEFHERHHVGMLAIRISTSAFGLTGSLLTRVVLCFSSFCIVVFLQLSISFFIRCLSQFINCAIVGSSTIFRSFFHHRTMRVVFSHAALSAFTFARTFVMGRRRSLFIV